MVTRMVEYIERDYVLKLLGVFNDRVHGDYHFMNGIETAKEIVEDAPSTDVQPVVRCKDCVYRPYYEPSDSKSASDLVFPDYRFNLCPCRVEDFWYSWMPDDDWSCAYGKRMDGET